MGKTKTLNSYQKKKKIPNSPNSGDSLQKNVTTRKIGNYYQGHTKYIFKTWNFSLSPCTGQLKEAHAETKTQITASDIWPSNIGVTTEIVCCSQTKTKHFGHAHLHI